MTATNFSAEVGRQQFLQLFVSQLKNQDPMEPTKQDEFLQQLALFSQVEGTENLNQQITTLNDKFDTLNDNVAALLRAQLDANKTTTAVDENTTANDTTALRKSANSLDDLKFAGSLIGSEVGYDNGYGKTMRGTVEQVEQKNGVIQLQILEKETNRQPVVPLTEIQALYQRTS
ncbi:MAG: hypothetical protein KDA85_03405 [Planctomycetaceae bacterium]|nr:hypothetical protein [Planctomycetaceae bacterium]